ncbi:MAG: T9SS type A sorting domain-containing protein [Chitinophagaceae bacterium]|nr:T9SS type A sorting domain-containing protein [Chitinophagaceae bacterium]
MNLKLYFSVLCILFATYQTDAQNLIVNPGAESPTTTGWTIVSQGTSCFGSSDWRIPGNQNGFPAAHGGNYFFFSGCNSVKGQIYQVVDVSSMAADIDAGNRNFTFTGFMQVYNQTPPDGSLMLVEYLGASDNLLVSYNTGLQSDKGVWTEYTSTITAPPGTRKVRITLKSYPFNGSSVDAYFDDLSLTSTQIVPLKLVSFSTVVNRNNEVVASWETANEMNTSRFELQRSKEGTQWQTVQTLQAAGNSTQNLKYSTIDKFPITGQSYYRLVEYDLDGKTLISSVNTVKTDQGKITLIAYPNPAFAKLTLEGSSGIFTGLRVFSSAGQDVTGRIIISIQNSSKVELNISQLTPGIYFVKAGDKSASFLKQ